MAQQYTFQNLGQLSHNAAGNRNINACMTWVEQR